MTQKRFKILIFGARGNDFSMMVKSFLSAVMDQDPEDLCTFEYVFPLDSKNPELSLKRYAGREFDLIVVDFYPTHTAQSWIDIFYHSLSLDQRHRLVVHFSELRLDPAVEYPIPMKYHHYPRIAANADSYDDEKAIFRKLLKLDA
ncbi:TPA: hypothetical protein DF272_02400 [Candidatus Falkowbacteria bacterium]|nr:hypothetical protein [Candidatus Falkowbacteria bacterium]